MSLITPELLKLHLIQESEKLTSEIEKGDGDRMYLIMVGVRMYRYESVKEWGKRELIYERKGFKVNIFIRWRWFFRYLASKEQIKTPKQLIQLQFYSYVDPNKDQVLKKVLNNKLIAAKRDYTKTKMAIEKAKEDTKMLFVEDDPYYIRAMQKLNEKKDLINAIESELKSLPPFS